MSPTPFWLHKFNVGHMFLLYIFADVDHHSNMDAGLYITLTRMSSYIVHLYNLKIYIEIPRNVEDNT